MSNTYRHRGQKHRHNGRDLWSRRIGGHRAYNSYNKFLTRRTERAAKKRIIALEIELSQ